MKSIFLFHGKLQTDVFPLLLAKNNFAENLSLHLLQFVPILAKALTIVETPYFI